MLCFLFMIGEIVGGVYANSLALLTDATHLASDLASFLISLFALYATNKQPTVRMSFGFHRAEVLGALLSVLIIWVATAVLVYLAVLRVINSDYTINADDMLITAGCGVAFNLIMGVVLHSETFACKFNVSFGGHGHSHSGDGHGHSHGYSSLPSSRSQSRHSRRKGRGEKSLLIRAAFIHILGDLIQSVGVLIAAYIIKYKPEWRLADPICTFLFSILVIITTVTVLRDAYYVIMEAVPKHIDYKAMRYDLQQIEGVKMAHSLHVWTLAVDQPAAAVHLAVVYGVSSYEILKRATKLLRAKYNISHSTIQVELYQPEVMSSCNQCIGPQ